MPTRNARNGMLFTWQGKINIRNEKWKDCFEPIDPQGTAWVDQQYTKAYLRHLFYSGEMLGPMMASVHNLAFYLDLVRTARTKIEEGVFLEWKNSVIKNLILR
jgi:queuine tRNA-ribosyltransferase